ncbi:MAG: hypothetical protein ACRD63_11930 [Pyrinomonadaceae bacterium]
MKINKLNSAFAVGLLIAAVLACNFGTSTARLRNARLSRDKEGINSVNTYAPMDDVFAVIEVTSAPDKTSIKCKVIVEAVEGIESDKVVFDRSLSLTGNIRQAYFQIHPPGAGWPEGKYKIEIYLAPQGGESQLQETLHYRV